MTKDEIFNLSCGPLVELTDGKIGMFLIYPIGKGDREGLCGIQVPGEEEHRWIHHDNLQDIGRGILKEKSND